MNAVMEPLRRLPLNLELQHEIKDFLLQEAELLDDGRFRDWLSLLHADIQYTMRTVTNAQFRDRRKGLQPPTTWIFNDNKAQLERRVARLETGMAWAEEPPSRTRHLVTNLRLLDRVGTDEYAVRLNYLLYRSQKEHDETFYVGSRIDHVRRADSELGWVLTRRELTLDQVVLSSHNISVIF